MIIDRRTTYDCAPTLTDEQVLDFCKAVSPSPPLFAVGRS